MFYRLRAAKTALFVFAASLQICSAQSLHPRLLDAPSDLPRVQPNDNRTPAGAYRDGLMQVNLEIAWADWRVETEDRPGLKVLAFAESGKAPTIPAPLIRVETGSRVRVQVHNPLGDSTITVFGLQSRPAEKTDSLVVPHGESASVEFDAGEPGTYYYWARAGAGMPFELGEEEQLAGAFIVDPKGGSPPDRVFVINIFSSAIDSTLHPYKWLEGVAINGLSWPSTERLRPSVGEMLRWRVVNPSQRNHPMHLHGFFYDVTASGTPLRDTVYGFEGRRKVVTETMMAGSTMAMEWVPSRPGTWLFHCHLMFHIAPEIRLPGAAAADHHHAHMAGLVLGIEVQPGPSDLISRGEPAHITMHAQEFASDSPGRYGFVLDPDFPPDSLHSRTPGPLLILKQYQTTYLTLSNHMPVPTAVHWHGLELDSWADGVPEWSASDGMISPVIPAGGEFTYKLSLLRPGTFIYHSHFDDITQITNGLYGAIVVMGEGETYDPSTDHVYIVGWRTREAMSLKDSELNGRMDQPVQHARVGETHRIRLINIAPAGMFDARMRMGAGPGIIGYDPELSWHQRWEVAER
jgi:FtsP/CotA-like multicopper oxidase with cupredoxin domain